MAATRFELLPIMGLQDTARDLPHGALVTVTCSPRHGLECRHSVTAGHEM